jgi:hypothetical protein
MTMTRKPKLTPVCRDAARAEEICKLVFSHYDNAWDAYNEGAWTWCAGMPRSDNPYLGGSPGSYYPTKNWIEWNRGWDEEASAHERDEDKDPDT